MDLCEKPILPYEHSAKPNAFVYFCLFDFFIITKAAVQSRQSAGKIAFDSPVFGGACSGSSLFEHRIGKENFLCERGVGKIFSAVFAAPIFDVSFALRCGICGEDVLGIFVIFSSI